MALTPEQLAKAGTEHAHQAALFCWAAGNPRLRWLHAVPNGGDRDVITAGRMKAEGVKAGVWDVHLPVASSGYVALWIEMKKPTRRKHRKIATGWSLDGNSVPEGTPRAIPTGCPPGTVLIGGLSEMQWVFGFDMHAQGAMTAVCYTWVEARDVIVKYLGLTAP